MRNDKTHRTEITPKIQTLVSNVYLIGWVKKAMVNIFGSVVLMYIDDNRPTPGPPTYNVVGTVLKDI